MCSWQEATRWADLFQPLDIIKLPNAATHRAYLVHHTTDGKPDAVAALQFIDFRLKPETQSNLSRYLKTAPVVAQDKTNLTDDEDAQVTRTVDPIIPYFDVYLG